MRRTSTIVLVFSLLASGTARAEKAISRFSHGPSIQAFRVSFAEDADGKRDAGVDVLAGGAGYSFNFNLVRTSDKSISWLTLAPVVYLSYSGADKAFAFTPGVTLGTYNNLLSIGVAYDAVRVADGPGDSGALFELLGVGEGASIENFYILINFGFNLGGTETGGDKKFEGDDADPPGFIRLW